MPRITVIPEFGTDAAIQFAGGQLADLFAADHLTGAQVKAKIAELARGVTGWGKLGKAFAAAEKIVRDAEAAAAATATLERMEAVAA
jgi:hypothetical protein